MKKLLILGAGQFGQLVKELAKDYYSIIDFLDDSNPIAIGTINDSAKYSSDYEGIVAIGNSKMRQYLFEKIENEGFKIPTIISKSAYVSSSAVIEQGCIIEPMSVINTGAVVRKCTFINAGAVINHNSIVNEFCQIDCNTVVGANAIVPPYTHLNYGEVFINKKI